MPDRIRARGGVVAAGLVLVGTLIAAAPALAVGAVSQYAMSPSPIAAAGSLAVGATKSIVVTAKDSTGTAVPSAFIYLGFFPTTNGGSASVGTTALTTKPVGFPANTSGQVTVSYKAGAAQGGRDEIKAQNTASSPTIVARDDYYYFGGSYKISPLPIAPGGTLKGSTVKAGTVTILSSGGTALPGATVYLSFVQATGGGSAMVGTVALTATPVAFVANTSGQVAYSYTTPAVVPSTGTDLLVAQDAPSGYRVTKKDYYCYGVPTSYAFSPTPVATSASLAAGASRSITLILKDGSGNPVAGGRTYLSFSGPGTSSVGKTALTTTPRATVADANGVITITFKAAATLPAHGSIATITAANLATGATLSSSDTYTY